MGTAVSPGQYRLAVSWPSGVATPATLQTYYVWIDGGLRQLVTVNPSTASAEFTDQGQPGRT